MLKMFVAISYRKGVMFCSEYDKCDGIIFVISSVESFPKCQVKWKEPFKTIYTR